MQAWNSHSFDIKGIEKSQDKGHPTMCGMVIISRLQ